MAEIYQIISVTAFLLGGAFLILTIVFWFRYRIRKIVGDLSGKTAQKAIAQIRTDAGKPGYQTMNHAIFSGKMSVAGEKNVSGSQLHGKTGNPGNHPADRRAESGRKVYTDPVAAGGNGYTGAEKTEELPQKTGLPEPGDQAESLGDVNRAAPRREGGEQTKIPAADRPLQDAPSENETPHSKPPVFDVVETIMMVHTDEGIS